MVGRVRSKALLALEEMTVPSAVRCAVVLTALCLTVGIVVSGFSIPLSLLMLLSVSLTSESTSERFGYC